MFYKYSNDEKLEFFASLNLKIVESSETYSVFSVFTKSLNIMSYKLYLQIHF